MAKYQKPTLIAKNLPTGSYAAGCPSKDAGGCKSMMFGDFCKQCDRAH